MLDGVNLGKAKAKAVSGYIGVRTITRNRQQKEGQMLI
jgi:hypothetical protein